ncbi:unnamed protein product, partial [Dicrocoelium dendriticum]
PKFTSNHIKPCVPKSISRKIIYRKWRIRRSGSGIRRFAFRETRLTHFVFRDVFEYCQMLHAVRNYDEDKERISDFLRTFCRTSESGIKHFIYSEQLTIIANREQIALYISLSDLSDHSVELAEAVEANVLRYQKLFAEVVDRLLPDYRTSELVPQDVLDIFIDHRIRMEQRIRAEDVNMAARPLNAQSASLSNVDLDEIRSRFPPELMRRFEVYFSGRQDRKALSVRSVLASQIGRLIQVRGLVTRATEVKPLISVATYTCNRCGAETYQ